jgi:hypothetical protein
LSNRKGQTIGDTFKSYLEGVLINLRFDNCPTLVRVLREGPLKLSMMNPWEFSSYLDAVGVDRITV